MTPDMLLDPEDQFACLNFLEFLLDIFTASDKESFTKAEMLVLLAALREEPDLFDPDVVIAHQIATEEISASVFSDSNSDPN